MNNKIKACHNNLKQHNIKTITHYYYHYLLKYFSVNRTLHVCMKNIQCTVHILYIHIHKIYLYL